MKINPWFAWIVLFEFDNTWKTQNMHVPESNHIQIPLHYQTSFHYVISTRKISKINVKNQYE